MLAHTPPTPSQIRAALVAHLARHLSWCGRTADHCLGPLSNDEIARCLTVEPAETRAALFTRSAIAYERAAKLAEVA